MVYLQQRACSSSRVERLFSKTVRCGDDLYDLRFDVAFFATCDIRQRNRFNAGPSFAGRITPLAGQPQDVPLLFRPGEDHDYPGRLPPEVPGVGSGEKRPTAEG